MGRYCHRQLRQLPTIESQPQLDARTPVVATSYALYRRVIHRVLSHRQRCPKRSSRLWLSGQPTCERCALRPQQTRQLENDHHG